MTMPFGPAVREELLAFWHQADGRASAHFRRSWQFAMLAP
jgi:hypothetical protein